MADRAITFKGADSKGVVSSIVDAFGSPLTFTIEARFKYQEDGNGAFRKIAWWGSESPLTTKGFCLGISPEGHLQFEAFEEAGLPSVPTLMGVMPLTGGFPPSSGVGLVRQVRVHGNYAFVTSGTGLTVVDVSNETVLTMVGTLPVIMDCQTLALSLDGTKAVLTGYRQYYDGAGAITSVKCLYVVDVSVPTSPKLIGTLETADAIFLGLAISGSYAYVACSSAGLKVVDLTNPAAPSVLTTYPTGNAYDVMVVGDYAYVADSGNGLLILNISNPGSPTFAGTYDTPGGALSVFVSGSIAYVADGNSVQILDISNPANPVFKGSFPQKANYVTASNGIAYVANPFAGLSMWDVNNPAAPTQIGTTLAPTGGPAASMVNVCLDPGDSSLIYCANGAAGLALVRTAPAPPHSTQLANISEWFNAAKVAVRGDLMIVAGTRFWNGGYNSSFGLRFLRNPAAPYQVGQFDNSVFSCPGVAISSSGLYAYVSFVGSTKGVKVFDISNAAVVGTSTNPAWAWANGIALSGNYVFVAAGTSGLRILDVSTPTAPVEVGFYVTGGNAKNVVVVGTKAYVADNTSLQIIDITTPTAPVPLGSYGSNCVDVAVNGNTAYLAASINGLQIVNVTDPGNVQPLGSLIPSGGINRTTVGVAVAGTKVCLANASAGMSIVDVTNPEFPVQSAALVTTGSAQGVIMDDGWAYVATSTGTINSFYLGS